MGRNIIYKTTEIQTARFSPNLSITTNTKSQPVKNTYKFTHHFVTYLPVLTYKHPGAQMSNHP
jgi:hypothetical protein